MAEWIKVFTDQIAILFGLDTLEEPRHIVLEEGLDPTFAKLL